MSSQHTQCLLEDLYTSTSEQLKHIIPDTLELTTAFEFHSLSANNSSWSNRELFEMEEVKFICSIKTFPGSAEQGCSTALLFPHVEQDSTGCLPKDQMNTDLEGPDPSLPNTSPASLHTGAARATYKLRLDALPHFRSLGDKSLFLKVLLLQQSQRIQPFHILEEGTQQTHF